MVKRWCIALAAMAFTAPGLTAQEEEAQDTAQEVMVQEGAPEAEMAPRPIPAGTYEFVPEESEEIEEKVKEAVSHMFFLIRGVAGRRLKGANEPIDRVIISYQADTLLVSLREDEPVVKTLMTGEYIPYTRADGEVVQVKATTKTNVIDMYFQSDDGAKGIIYTLGEGGRLELESTSYSDKLKEPFSYVWVYQGEDTGEAMEPAATEADTMAPDTAGEMEGEAEAGEGEGGEAGEGEEGGGGLVAAPGPPGLMGRPVHTYSIVARDPDSGELGVAVQSHWFSVGPLVVWAEPGVGAVATQSFVDPSYGPLGLELMTAGKTAEQALAALVSADEHPEVRQVAMVDAAGNVSVHTGAKAIQAAGHETGPGYSVQANLMLSGTVPSAMARAFEDTEGDLTERLLSALEAAQAEGGDIRGKQSAAILVVSGEPSANPWQGRVVDLRVEDHPEPVQELRRLVMLDRAYDHMNAGDEALTEGDVARALEEYSTAGSMVPDEATNGEMAFWHAATLASLGRVEESLPLFRRAFAQDENWRTLVPRLVDAGQFPDDPELVSRITELGR